MTAKALPLEMVASSTGERLMPADIAHAMGRVPFPNGAVLRAVYLGDGQAVRAVVKYFIDKKGPVGSRMIRGQWLRKQGYYPALGSRMIGLALHELSSPAKCKSCEGHAWTILDPDHPVRVPCPTCNATGVGAMTVAQQARIVDMHYTSWDRYWKPRYLSDVLSVIRWSHDAGRDRFNREVRNITT